MFHYICLAPQQFLNTCIHVHAGACFIISCMRTLIICLHVKSQASCNWWLLPQLQLLTQIAVLEEGSMGFNKPKKKGRLQLVTRFRATGIWQWRERVWSEEMQAYKFQWVSYELSHQTHLTNLGCNHFVFTMLHFVFIMFRTWRHAGEREFLNCFFGDKQQAARLRFLAWASIAENPGWRQLAEISLAEKSWQQTLGL